MKRLVVGILAHVDAGKTTLSEAILYLSGSLRKLGRVDHRDAFLDTFQLERQRGITIFSKQAEFSLPGADFTLLDTPGHVDFSSEMERTLQVLDCAVLVISAGDGVQGHTRTLWELLRRAGIPTFLFVNKMDLAGSEEGPLLAQLRSTLSPRCVSFSSQRPPAALFEELAVGSEEALSEYLESGALRDETVAQLFANRQVFPCLFGSALKLQGVDELLGGLQRYVQMPAYPAAFGAKVFKITRDEQGTRLAYLKITGGSLRVKDPLQLPGQGPEEGGMREEKVDQIRLYSGARYKTLEKAESGMICAVTGLSGAFPGLGLGFAENAPRPQLQPVLTYQIFLPEGSAVYPAYQRLRQLEEEEPSLHLRFDEGRSSISAQLMGEVQMEVLQQLALSRFGLAITFGDAKILYKETIAAPVEGVGHFEPLRHYAEVHLLMEPAPPGSGLLFESRCDEEVLAAPFQRLVLTHLKEKEHLGVLCGAPITDMKITLMAGRAHLKHTEGGDFREATYRAVRQGLQSAQSVLLEPYYELRLRLTPGQVGKALSDLQKRGAELSPPGQEGEMAVLCAVAPVSAMEGYAAAVRAYAGPEGRFTARFLEYRPCKDAAKVAAKVGYRSERDLENPADSVFCIHGAGVVVKWNEVPSYMHLPSCLPKKAAEEKEAGPALSPRGRIDEEELRAIFERTYGPIRRKTAAAPAKEAAPAFREEEWLSSPEAEYLLVDGYNVIYGWDELKALSAANMDSARTALLEVLSNYAGFHPCEVIVVFDAYKTQRASSEAVRYSNIWVVYTKEAQTADAYIEMATYKMKKHGRVRVATSDGAEQMIVLGHGAGRLSARMLKEEVEDANRAISQTLAEYTRQIQARERAAHRESAAAAAAKFEQEEGPGR